MTVTSSFFNSTIKYLCKYSQVKSLAVFLYKMECDKNENLYLSRKSEGYGETVVLECEGLYYNLRRNNSVGDRVCEPVERAAYCGNGLLRILKSEG